MPNQEIDDFTALAEGPAVGDLLVVVDTSDTTDSAQGTTKKNEARYGLGNQVNPQTGTTYTYLATDFRKLVTHTNGSAIAGTLPQASATFPAGWFMFVQNRGAGALTITPTTSTIDGAATLVLNQNEGALVVSDGTNYFSMRGKATGGVGGVGDVVGPASATDNAIARFDAATGKLLQDSVVIVSDAGAITVPEIAAPSTPAAGTVHIYAKSDGKLYIKDDAGTETDLTAAGGAGYAGVTTGGTGSLDFAQGTKTADEPFVDASVTYNSSGITFNGILLSIVDTASAVGSKLLSFLVGGTPVFRVQKANSTIWQTQITDGNSSVPGLAGINDADTGIQWNEVADVLSFVCGGGVVTRIRGGQVDINQSGGIEQRGGGPYRWQSSTRLIDLGNALQIAGNTTADGHALVIGEDGVNGVRLKRNGTAIEARLGNDSAYTHFVSAGNKFVATQFDKTNTTLADVTGLTTEALLAGKTYGFEALLFIDADVVGGSKYAIGGTTTATAIKYEIVFISDSANSMVITSRQTALGGSAGQAGTTAGVCRISGAITVNAAGTLTVQFAQNAANGTSSVLTMSHFRVWQMN